jgi:hypothetical protein
MKIVLRNWDKNWPIKVEFYEPWLDSKAYILNAKKLHWLSSKNIKYFSKQDGKWFNYYLTNEKDASLFLMRFS